MGICMTISKPPIHNQLETKRSHLSTNLNAPSEEHKTISLEFTSGVRKIFKPKISALDSRLEEEAGVDACSAVVSHKKKSKREIENIKYSLSKHFIFNSLTEEQIESIVSDMRHYQLTSNSVVFEQNTPGNNFFVVASGKLEVIINDIRIKILKSGDSFGELALLHDTPRSATIKTIEKTML